ncbi:facilitated trehalose transporter Tret1-like isoform X1 [Belonocnema kinseyi]|uniref:facilitated trehalose transporter Tret1-like isoform X1 n=2 Tax=Belonocnema kinseyi TaxID=2817044 RepID=UPI00143D4E60|nr:facilitated trehalose transporter Tret1-like isoform X1 [Belonocnema kinseyi]
MSNLLENPFDRNNIFSAQDVQNLMAGESNPDPPEDNSNLKYQLRQWFTALGAIIGAILAGMTGAYSAVLIPQLEKNAAIENFTQEYNIQNSTFMTSFLENFAAITIETTGEKSWLGSSAALLLAPGCWMSGFMIEKLGRRMTHIVTAPLYFLAWFIVTISPNMITLIIGRLLCGLCMGLLGPACPVYIAETTNPRLRGILLGCISVAASTGNLLAHAAGTWLHWRLASLFCGSFNILCFVICILSPESPTWYLKKGRIEDALDAWRFLRGSTNSKEFEKLKVAHAPGFSQKASSGIKSKIDDEKDYTWKDIMVSKSFLKPLGIVCLLFFTAQCCGVNAITFYSVTIFVEVAGREGAFMWTLILDVVRVLVCGLTCWLIKRHSNRGLALGSGLGSAAVLILLAIVQFFEIGKPWAPVSLLFVYTFTAFVGLVPLSWMLCGELFPMSYKGLGTGLTSGFGFLCLFSVVMTSPYMFKYLLAWGTFLAYGCVAATGTFLLFCYLPETRGKTLLEIERSFDKKIVNDPEVVKELEMNSVV